MDTPLAGRAEHGPCVVWFTGLSGAGKTTIARIAQAELAARGYKAFLLDGDVLRAGLCSDLGFTEADRSENLRRAAEVAALMADLGFVVLAALITPRQADRDRLRARFTLHPLIEVFVDTPLSVAEARDPKGLYRRARQGELKNFTGIDSPFDLPTRSDLCLDTVATDPVSLAERVVAAVVHVADMRGRRTAPAQTRAAVQ